MGNKKQHQKDIDATLKSMDTEEWLDIHFTRPLGYVWALFFNKFNIHPNVVTILSIILGIAAGICFYYSDMTHTILGIFLLIWANIYDSTDGQLARMTGKKPVGEECLMVLPVIYGFLLFILLSVYDYIPNGA